MTAPSPELRAFRISLVRATVLPLAIALGMAALFFWQVNDLLKITERVERSDAVIFHINRALKLMVDAETGMRGALLTGREEFLQPYRAAHQALPESYRELEAQLADRPKQLDRFHAIRQEFQEWAHYADRLLSERGHQVPVDPTEAEIQRAGKQQMDDIRFEFERMLGAEAQLRDRRTLHARQAARFTLGAGIGLTLFLGLFLAVITRQSLLGLSRTYQRSLREAQEGREWFATTLASIGDAVIATDPEGTVTFVNPVAEALTQWSSADAGRQPLDKVFPIVHEDTQEALESPVTRVIRERRVVGLANHTALVTRDGRQVVIEDSAAPILGRDGSLRGVVLVFRDATDKKRREMERQELLERAQAAQAEAESQRNNLQSLFMQSPAAIAIVEGPELRYTLSNPMNTELVGGRPLVGRTVAEALPELEAQGLTALLQHVRSTGLPFVGNEVPVAVTDPRTGITRQRFINGTYQPLRDRQGQINGVMVFAYDVTDMVQARRAVEEAERSAVLIAETIPLMVWRAQPDGTVDFYNQRWREYTGRTLEQVQAAGGWQEICHPSDYAELRQRWARHLPSGESFEHEVRLRRASDGAYRWHLLRTAPLRDSSGRVTGWFGSATDIDDTKRAEETSRFLAEAGAVLSSSLDYQETLERVAFLIVPRLTDWCTIHLKEESEAVARQRVLAHVDPTKTAWARALNEARPLDPRAARGAHAVIRSGKPELYPEIGDPLLGAGSEEEVRSAMVVPLTARGRTFGAISFISSQPGRKYGAEDLQLARELADRAAAAVDNAWLYNEARESVRIRDEFLSIASHELRTPLTPLQLQIQSLQRGRKGVAPELPPRTAEKLERISRQVTRLEQLISSLLDVTRITGKRLSLMPEPVDLAALTVEVADRFAEQAAQAKTKLAVEAPAALVGQWDRLRLEQILVNLISNAIKFGAGQPIEIAARQQDGWATLIVTDHGIGIAPEDQARIFGRFERAVPSRHYGGLGLGLWVSQQIAQAMGGAIGVESALARGSTFALKLPL